MYPREPNIMFVGAALSPDRTWVGVARAIELRDTSMGQHRSFLKQCPCIPAIWAVAESTVAVAEEIEALGDRFNQFIANESTTVIIDGDTGEANVRVSLLHDILLVTALTEVRGEAFIAAELACSQLGLAIRKSDAITHGAPEGELYRCYAKDVEWLPAIATYGFTWQQVDQAIKATRVVVPPAPSKPEPRKSTRKSKMPPAANEAQSTLFQEGIA